MCVGVWRDQSGAKDSKYRVTPTLAADHRAIQLLVCGCCATGFGKPLRCGACVGPEPTGWNREGGGADARSESPISVGMHFRWVSSVGFL